MENLKLFVWLSGSLTQPIQQSQATLMVDGSYTRMLSAALNKSWIDHLSNAELYGNIPRVTATIRQQRLRFAGHCCCSKNEPSSEVLLWEWSHGKHSRGRPRKTYVDQLIANAVCGYEDLVNLMDNRDRWKEQLLINESRASST